MALIRLSVFLLLITVNSQAQQMTYVKNGTVSLNDKAIKRPRELKKILEKQNSQELMKVYQKYIWRKRSAQFFSIIAGLGLVSAVEDEFGPNPKINWAAVGIAVGASITAEFFHRPANRALKEIVDIYNEEIYFQPIRKR
ncbi:hypothetical protein GCM10027035_32560 [Emticicia sediminis]